MDWSPQRPDLNIIEAACDDVDSKQNRKSRKEL